MKNIMFEPLFAGVMGGSEILILLLILLILPSMALGFFVLRHYARKNDPPKIPPPSAPVGPSTARVCKSCGTQLSPTSSEGLCPACLMKVAIGSEGGNPGASSSERKPAPSPEEIAKHFPQLEILQLLGHGGMGMVYKARQPQLDRLIALKILSPELSRDPAFAERFNREAKALARLNHPNIVGVYDFGKTGDFYYFIMEFVDGMNLWDLERAKKRLAPEEALAIVPKICDALQYAHDEGIVHRDIKPGNILIDKKGRVKIADFGLAKIVGKQSENFSLTQTKMTLGTPHYMAPEQLADPQKVDHRADIYSLGVVFYEMLTGELPMGRFALPSEKVHVDVRLDEVVLRTLQQEPGRRYQHVSEVKTDVETIAGVMEKLPPHLRLAMGYEYRSKKTFFGVPLVHVAYGVDFATGKSKTAHGIFAFGGKAEGVFAFGGVARGIFAFGGVAVGLFATGGVAFGLVGLGGLAIGLLLAYGGGAIGTIALGGGAIGYYAMGGGAWGVHAIGGNARDSVAKIFFETWDVMWVNYLFVTVCLLTPLVGVLVPKILRRYQHTGEVKTAMETIVRSGSIPSGSAADKSVCGPTRFSRSWRFAAVVFVIILSYVVSRTIFSNLITGRSNPVISASGPPPATAMSEQVLMEYDWKKLADAGRLLGGVPMKLDGQVVLKIENTNDEQLQLSLFIIEPPPITATTYALTGEIKYENVQGGGYLEMWSHFPETTLGVGGGRFFSRTLGNAGSGPMGKISGTSSWRAFSLPFDRTSSLNPPMWLAVNIVLPGRGVVFLGPVKLIQWVKPGDSAGLAREAITGRSSKLVLSSSDVVSGSTTDSRLVIDAMKFDVAHPEPGELNWGFKCFVPPDHLATFLFVRWTNGVPAVDQSFSTYFKVGKAGGIDLFCFVSCYRIVSESGFSKLTDAERRHALAAWGYPESACVTNAVRWNVSLGAGSTVSRWIAMPSFSRIETKFPQSVRSGHQRVIPLVESDRTEGAGNHGQSGVELRVFLEPLKSPPIRMLPNEVDRTNYVSGSGLAGTMDEALNNMKNLPIDP